MNKIPLFLDGHFLGFAFKNHNGTYSMSIDGIDDVSSFNNINDLNTYMKDYGIVAKSSDAPNAKEYPSLSDTDLNPTDNIQKGFNTFSVSNPTRTFPQNATTHIDAEKQILNDPIFQVKDKNGNLDKRATIKKAQQWFNQSNYQSNKGSLKEDGIVGPRTMEAFNTYAKDALLNSQVSDELITPKVNPNNNTDVTNNTPNIIKPQDVVKINNDYQHNGPPLSSAVDPEPPVKNVDIMRDIVGYKPELQNNTIQEEPITPSDEEENKVIKPSDVVDLYHTNNMGNAWFKTNNRFVPVSENNLVQIRTRDQNTQPLNRTDHVIFGGNNAERDPNKLNGISIKGIGNVKLFPKLQDRVNNFIKARKEAKQEIYDQPMDDGSGLSKGELLNQLRENNDELPLTRYKKRQNLKLERQIGRQQLKELRDQGKLDRIVDDNETGENIIRTKSATKQWLEPHRQEFLTNANSQENDLREENSALNVGNRTFKRYENLEDRENYFNDKINQSRDRMNQRVSNVRSNFINRLKNRRGKEDYPIEFLEEEYTQPEKKQFGGNMNSIGNKGYYTDIGDFQLPETYIPQLSEDKLKERFYNGLSNSKPSESFTTRNLGNGNDPNFSLRFNESISQPSNTNSNTNPNTTTTDQPITQSGYDPTRLMYYGNKMQHMGNLLPTMYNTSKYLFDKPEVEIPRYNNQESTYLGGMKNLTINPNMEPINTTQRAVFDTIRNNSRNTGQMLSNLQTAATNTTRAANEEAYKAKLANVQFKQQYLGALNNVGDQHRLIDEQNYLRNQQHRLAKENLGTAAIESGEKTLINKAQLHNQEQADWMKAQLYLNEIADDYKVVPDANGTYQIVFKPKGQNNYQTINFSDLGQFNNTLKTELYGKEEKPAPNGNPSGPPSSYSVNPAANTTKVKKYGGIIIKRNFI